MTRDGEKIGPEPVTGCSKNAERWLDDLSTAAGDRIRRFMAESTVRGGARPGDVADLYTAHEVLDDASATEYLDRRFVHGDVPADWREFQDQLSAAYFSGRPGMSVDDLLARVRDYTDSPLVGRSIFDDPDDDELNDEGTASRLEDRDPNLADLDIVSRRVIERYIVSEVLCYGVAPYRVMQLREDLRSAGDERALQYLDLPFELGDRPADWDSLRDRALMLRARLEMSGTDPSDAYARTDSSLPDLDADDLLREIEDRDRLR